MLSYKQQKLKCKLYKTSGKYFYILLFYHTSLKNNFISELISSESIEKLKKNLKTEEEANGNDDHFEEQKEKRQNETTINGKDNNNDEIEEGEANEENESSNIISSDEEEQEIDEDDFKKFLKNFMKQNNKFQFCRRFCIREHLKCYSKDFEGNELIHKDLKKLESCEAIIFKSPENVSSVVFSKMFGKHQMSNFNMEEYANILMKKYGCNNLLYSEETFISNVYNG